MKKNKAFAGLSFVLLAGNLFFAQVSMAYPAPASDTAVNVDLESLGRNFSAEVQRYAICERGGQNVCTTSVTLVNGRPTTTVSCSFVCNF